MVRRSGVLAAVVLAPAALVGAVLVGIRTKYPPVVRLVTRFARDVGNPRALKTAGTPGGAASVIMHTGRKSGKAFRAPVTPMATPDGFVIALPYGAGTDWVRNVLAAGSTRLVHEGRTYVVERPVVLPLAEVSAAFAPRERRFLRLFGVKECLRLDRVDAAGT